jgi:hypothetical protein
MLGLLRHGVMSENHSRQASFTHRDETTLSESTLLRERFFCGSLNSTPNPEFEKVVDEYAVIQTYPLPE